MVVVQRTMLNEEVEMECCWLQQSKKNEISDVAVVNPSPHGSVCDAESNAGHTPGVPACGGRARLLCCCVSTGAARI